VTNESREFNTWKAKPTRVDVLHNETDFRVALMGALGFTTECISGRTGLTRCQVDYRLHKAGITRASYRTGNNPLAKKLIEKMPGAQLLRNDLRVKMRLQYSQH
jgi:hypothetical protein